MNKFHMSIQIILINIFKPIPTLLPYPLPITKDLCIHE